MWTQRRRRRRKLRSLWNRKCKFFFTSYPVTVPYLIFTVISFKIFSQKLLLQHAKSLLNKNNLCVKFFVPTSWVTVQAYWPCHVFCFLFLHKLDEVNLYRYLNSSYYTMLFSGKNHVLRPSFNPSSCSTKLNILKFYFIAQW
jgi:hypothetical protein